MPAASQRTLLTQLADAGAALRYHGDFDWPGIGIGNYVMRRFGARPWRFGAADYSPTPGHQLEGRAAAASWDACLGPKMTALDRALDEEWVIEHLIADLAQAKAAV